MMTTQNYQNYLDRKVHIVRVELLDGKIFEGEIIGNSFLGLQFKTISSCGTPEYIIINKEAIKSLEDLGYV